jgi:excisionase family DNA binding protein
MPRDPRVALVSTEEAARLFSTHPETLRKRYRAGKLPGYKIGSALRFDPDEVRDVMRRDAQRKPERPAKPKAVPDLDAPTPPRRRRRSNE